MTGNYTLANYYIFLQRGQSGNLEDVDFLMQILETDSSISAAKLVDFALGFVRTRQGKERLIYYLFEGAQVQRNYAANYFKRIGHIDLLQKAFMEGKIDHEQAFAS
jgi:hypothetical protein